MKLLQRLERSSMFYKHQMIKHVGPMIVDKTLKSGDAATVVTSSTLPELRYSLNQAEDFSRKYIGSNAYLPAPTNIINANHGSRYSANGTDAWQQTSPPRSS
ncbi:hypothetical protein EDB86DRAFT_2943920 [Lactarius hatsudake]|nr:hypothetical protein EDB86DRAFT_2943920 [Lactarius hatsudake]